MALDRTRRISAGAARRLHRQGADQLGIAFQLRLADRAIADGMVGGDQRVQLFRQHVLVESRLLQIEVEPALAFADRTAGDAALHDGAEEVEGGVHPHMRVAARPVDLRVDLVADRGQRTARGRDVPHPLGAVLDRVHDGHRAAVRHPQDAAVAGLPTAGGIENRPIQTDTLGTDGDDGRRAASCV